MVVSEPEIHIMMMKDLPEKKQSPDEEKLNKIGFWQVVRSVLSAALGVQTSKIRKRDFTHGNPLHFIAAGLIFTILFVTTLIGIVHLLL